MLLLKCELERRGHKVYLFNKDQDISLINHKDAVALIPNSSHAKDLNAYRYKFNLKANRICILSNEQIVFKMPPDFDCSDDNPAKYLPRLCWGKDYYNFLRTYDINEEYLFITGAMQLDYASRAFYRFYKSRIEIAEQYNLPLDKKWILFIAHFKLANDEYLAQLKKSTAFRQEGADCRSEYEKKMQLTIVEWFDEFLENHSDYIVIYRKHPVEVKNKCLYDEEKRRKGFFYEISDYDIKQWIVLCDKITCFYSTSAIESSVAGKECILLRPEEIPDEACMRDYSFFVDYPKVKTYAELEDSILFDHKEYVDLIMESVNDTYYFGNKPAFYNVADVLETINESFSEPKIAENYEYDRWAYLLKNHTVFKVLCKKIFRCIYSLTGISPFKEGNMAIKEWVAYSEKKHSLRSDVKKLQSIIYNVLMSNS